MAFSTDHGSDEQHIIPSQFPHYHQFAQQHSTHRQAHSCHCDPCYQIHHRSFAGGRDHRHPLHELLCDRHGRHRLDRIFDFVECVCCSVHGHATNAQQSHCLERSIMAVETMQTKRSTKLCMSTSSSTLSRCMRLHLVCRLEFRVPEAVERAS